VSATDYVPGSGTGKDSEQQRPVTRATAAAWRRRWEADLALAPPAAAPPRAPAAAPPPSPDAAPAATHATNGHRLRNGTHPTDPIDSPASIDRGFAESQRQGLSAMFGIARAGTRLAEISVPPAPGDTIGGASDTAPVRPDGHHDLHRHPDGPADGSDPPAVAAREGCRGALNASYDIPDVALKPVRKVPYTLVAIAVAIIGLARHADFISVYERYRVLMVSWTIVFVLAFVQWLLSLRERPYTGWSHRLDELQVVVSLPVYNEDQPTLDRVLYSLTRQTRLPDIVHVVDDGSRVSYQEVREHWENDAVLGPRLMWTRQPNAGKKHAQCTCFTAHPDADVFVTLDSDTTLTGNAIEEGLRPFLHRDVYSVAGLELAWNHSQNWLTLMSGSRTMSWQLLSCAAQNVAGGDVTVNRGTFALYRADMIRDIVPAYLGEKFLGHPIKLGDDAALTLFAECRGRAVQQPTAVCLAMYPESLGHHLRQWIRWMRGSTVRTFWRLRYLRLASYTWWFTLLSTWSFTVSVGATIAAAVTWPRSETYAATAALATIAWAVVMALRTTTVHRSDQDWVDRLLTVLMAPMAAFWVTLVLRPTRLYGIATFLRQGWVTRSQIEIATALPDGEISASAGGRP
jgi:hyaluronan synthase